MFDVVGFLEEYGIMYHTSGKNVSTGWVEINCPFCSDPSFHMGVNLSSGLHHCWHCGTKGSPEYLVKTLLNIPFTKAKGIVQDFDSAPNIDVKEKPKTSIITFPKGIEKELPQMHKRYLISRGFDPIYIQKEYGIMGCLHLGKEFAYRIIIPIVMDGQIVSFTSRDVSGKATSKYKHLANESSIVQVKDSIYNIDSVKDKIIIMEGVMDVWRVGKGSVALFGTEWTTRQLNLLYEKGITNAFVLFDHDATRKSHKLANILSSFIPKVEVLEIDDGDPADMGVDEVDQLKRDLGF